jgi:hypothetical protein
MLLEWMSVGLFISYAAKTFFLVGQHFWIYFRLFVQEPFDHFVFHSYHLNFIIHKLGVCLYDV